MHGCPYPRVLHSCHFFLYISAPSVICSITLPSLSSFTQIPTFLPFSISPGHHFSHSFPPPSAVGLETPCCHIAQPLPHQTFLNHGMLFPGPSLKCPFPCLPQLPSLCLIFYLPVGSIPVFFINSLFRAHIHPQHSYSSNFSVGPPSFDSTLYQSDLSLLLPPRASSLLVTQARGIHIPLPLLPPFPSPPTCK